MTDTKNTLTQSEVSGAALRGRSSQSSFEDFFKTRLRQNRGEAGVSSSFLFTYLGALGWRGSPRNLYEVMPHFADSMDATEIRNVLAKLGYNTRLHSVKNIEDLDPRLLPALAVTKTGEIYLVLGSDGSKLMLVSAKDGSFDHLETLPGLAKVFVSETKDNLADPQVQAGAKSDQSWTLGILGRFYRAIGKMFFMSLLLNMLALATPLFIMLLYDQVVPVRSMEMWFGLTSGVALALLFEGFFRYKRARMIAYVGSRIDFMVTSSTFSKLLHLPAGMTENVSLGNQVAKLRDFDNIRDIFSGLLVGVLLDLPFLLIALFLLWLIAGPLALVPLAMLAMYGVLWFALMPALKRAVAQASRAKAIRHGFLVEATSSLRGLKENALEAVWGDRFRTISSDAALSHFKTSRINTTIQTLSQTLMTISALATLAIGVDLTLSETLSLGGLIASMAITWRILNPVQALFLSLTRAEQIRSAVRQLDALMTIQGELAVKKSSSGIERRFMGGATFNRVSLRYTAFAPPALLGVDFTVRPGEFLVITGNNGSGKSSILQLLLGMKRPQAGQVMMDGIDIRQLTPHELRTAIAYVPQAAQLFHGTIEQNLRLSNPSANDADMRAACELAGVLDEIDALRDGFDTRVGDQTVLQNNSGFLQKLALARAYVTEASVLVLDEPARALDEIGDRQLEDALKTLKGTKTIIMVSHRHSHIRLADRVVMLNRGSIDKIGRPEEVL